MPKPPVERVVVRKRRVSSRSSLTGSLHPGVSYQQGGPDGDNASKFEYALQGNDNDSLTSLSEREDLQEVEALPLLSSRGDSGP